MKLTIPNEKANQFMDILEQDFDIIAPYDFIKEQKEFNSEITIFNLIDPAEINSLVELENEFNKN